MAYVAWTVLLPFLAVVTALLVLAVQMRRMDRELAGLRESLRRVSATAVSSDDLLRSTAHLAKRAGEQQEAWRQRVSASTRPSRHR